jgi:streptogramin lyase
MFDFPFLKSKDASAKSVIPAGSGSRFAVVVFFFVAGVLLHGFGSAQSNSSSAAAALGGAVTSQAEGEMEGVLVTAKGVGGTVAVTVVTDKQGRYAFPRNRLRSGQYRMQIRAVGYDLEDPGTIEVQAGRTKNVNLKLRNTRDLASQLSNVEWLLSVPGTEKQRSGLGGCVGCHPIAFAAKSTHDAAEWRSVLHRMRNYASSTFWLNPKKWPWEVPPRAGDAELAEYLSSINLSAGPERKYELKTQPRPKGAATRVIITEYDLPRRESQPHDASVAPDGMVWYSDFGLPYLGRLNPSTGEIKEWRIPVARKGAAEGSLDVKFDREGNPWVGLLLQRSVAKFDVKTETFKTWAIPEEKASNRSRAGMVAMGPDGKVWLKTSVDTYGAHLLDPLTGDITSHPLPLSFYGADSNSKGDLYLASLSDGVIGEVIAKTGKVSVYPTPTKRSGSRRGHVDEQDRFWFAEFFAHQIGMFDTTTKQFQEWPIDTPWAGPYDAVRDRNGYVWSGGMHTDLIYRLNPVSGEVIKYLIPTLSPNFRNIDVDSSTDPVSVWLGANHQAKIIRVEPLE